VAETIEELRSLPKDEIIRRHDARAGNVSVGTQHYLDELARRDAEGQGRRMEALTESLNRLTRWIVGLTVLIAIVTIISVGPEIWTLVSGA
jgi:hypothetical protein